MLLQQQPGRHQHIGIVINNKNGRLSRHARTVTFEVFEIDHLFAIAHTFMSVLLCKLLILLVTTLAQALLL